MTDLSAIAAGVKLDTVSRFLAEGVKTNHVNSTDRRSMQRRAHELDVLTDMIIRLLKANDKLRHISVKEDVFEQFITVAALKLDFDSTAGQWMLRDRFTNKNAFDYWMEYSINGRLLQAHGLIADSHLLDVITIRSRDQQITIESELNQGSAFYFEEAQEGIFGMHEYNYPFESNIYDSVEQLTMLTSADPNKKWIGYYCLLFYLLDMQEFLTVERGSGQKRNRITPYGTSPKFFKFILSMFQRPMNRFMANPDRHINEIMWGEK